MTVAKLKKILEKVDDTVKVTGNSGWECGPTDVESAYYLPRANRIELCQGIEFYEDRFHRPEDGWECLSKDVK